MSGCAIRASHRNASRRCTRIVAVDATGERGEIVCARCLLWKHAPHDLQMFAKENKLCSNHPTATQFLPGEVFDAYRALGFAVSGVPAGALTLPPKHFDEPREALRARPVGTTA